MEGILFKAIRGNGLAYGVGIEVDPDNQLLSFGIYRSAQLEQAYEKAKEVVVRIFMLISRIRNLLLREVRLSSQFLSQKDFIT